ncbi:MAG: UDP-N-acetylglucosamine transferase subunit ALG14 [Geminicoccaceae bacterium]|nr:UDP-N-acetylglucosamine transferase subunit ALG14 [Geminicoccaceae bacterium]
MSEILHVEPRRTCLAYSRGGHLAELERALEGIVFLDCYHVTYGGGRPTRLAARRIYSLCHPRRSFLRTLLNALQAFFVLLRERPRLVISTGADVAVPTVILGKLSGAEVIFIETAAALRGSLSGRLCRRFADLFIVQWPEQKARFPEAQLASGPLL